MAKVFWVVCPKCSGRYYVNINLLGKNMLLFCPFCKHFFKEKEAKEIIA
jgi:predicted Zn finger-like uncharacterized protein